jgi:hypothetical protein
VGSSRIVEEAFIVLDLWKFKLFKLGSKVEVPQRVVKLSLFCWSPLMLPAIRARSSVVAAESFGICTFPRTVPVEQLVFDDKSIEEGKVLLAVFPSTVETDGWGLEVVLGVPWVVSRVDAREEVAPFCRDIPRIWTE